MEPEIGALSLTVIAMIIVFGVLWGLALIITLMKWLSVKRQKEEVNTQESPVDVVSAPKDNNTGVTPETVAAITAALAAYLDQGADQLFVSAIYRLTPGESWAAAGRLESISSSSLIRRSF